MHPDPNATIIDMTPDGAFRQPPPQPLLGFGARGIAALVAVAASLVLVLALAIWLAITVVPVLIFAGLAAILVARLKSWHRRRAFGPIVGR